VDKAKITEIGFLAFILVQARSKQFNP